MIRTPFLFLAALTAGVPIALALTPCDHKNGCKHVAAGAGVAQLAPARAITWQSGVAAGAQSGSVKLATATVVGQSAASAACTASSSCCSVSVSSSAGGSAGSPAKLNSHGAVAGQAGAPTQLHTAHAQVLGSGTNLLSSNPAVLHVGPHSGQTMSVAGLSGSPLVLLGGTGVAEGQVIALQPQDREQAERMREIERDYNQAIQEAQRETQQQMREAQQEAEQQMREAQQRMREVQQEIEQAQQEARQAQAEARREVESALREALAEAQLSRRDAQKSVQEALAERRQEEREAQQQELESRRGELRQRSQGRRNVATNSKAKLEVELGMQAAQAALAGMDRSAHADKGDKYTRELEARVELLEQQLAQARDSQRSAGGPAKLHAFGGAVDKRGMPMEGLKQRLAELQQSQGDARAADRSGSYMFGGNGGLEVIEAEPDEAPAAPEQFEARSEDGDTFLWAPAEGENDGAFWSTGKRSDKSPAQKPKQKQPKLKQKQGGGFAPIAPVPPTSPVAPVAPVPPVPPVAPMQPMKAKQPMQAGKLPAGLGYVQTAPASPAPHTDRTPDAVGGDAFFAPSPSKQPAPPAWGQTDATPSGTPWSTQPAHGNSDALEDAMRDLRDEIRALRESMQGLRERIHSIAEDGGVH